MKDAIDLYSLDSIVVMHFIVILNFWKDLSRGMMYD